MSKTIEHEASYSESINPVFGLFGDKGRKNTMALIVCNPQGLRAADIVRELPARLNRKNIPASTVANYLANLEDVGLVISADRVGNRRGGGRYVATEFGLEAFQGATELGIRLARIKADVEREHLLGRLSPQDLDRLIELAKQKRAQEQVR